MQEKIKKYINNHDLTQRQMANLLGMTESHLSRVLSGNKNPGPKMIKAYNNLPGIDEQNQLRQVLDYLMLEFSKGNLNQKILRGALKEQNIFASESINPQD